MEDNKEKLISEFIDTLNELEESDYIAGTQGKPPSYMPLPERIKLIIAVNKALERAYTAGQKREPYKLLLSGKYITRDTNATYDGNIEKKPTADGNLM